MSNRHVIRAWKDRAYRNTLSQAELTNLPPNPAGAIEVSDEDLGKIAAGASSTVCSIFCTNLECPTVNFCSWDCPSAFNCPTDWCTVRG
jgi:mersacidin/lichenicidin family type 2 lantibiotic